jgi:hypothetical protein
MKAGELIGRTLMDILGVSEEEDGMDHFNAFLILDGNVSVKIPIDFDDEMEEEWPLDGISIVKKARINM